MLPRYHREILKQALLDRLSPSVFETVVAANLDQDHWLRGQIGHPEYHFDQNAFSKSWDYMERNRAMIRPALELGDALSAQRALGRLTHAGQDLYAHSNYVPQWLSRFPKAEYPPAEEIDAFDRELLEGGNLRSGKIYWPLEPLSWIPFLKKYIVPILPRNSHAWMNLDDPERGFMYPYAFEAAVKRTRYEYEQIVRGLSPLLTSLFCGKNSTYQEV